MWLKSCSRNPIASHLQMHSLLPVPQQIQSTTALFWIKFFLIFGRKNVSINFLFKKVLSIGVGLGPYHLQSFKIPSTSYIATRCQKCNTECVTFLMLHMLRVYWSAWFLMPQISNSIYIWTNYFWDVMFAVQVLQHYLSLTSLPAPIVLILLFNLIRYVLHHIEQVWLIAKYTAYCYQGM